LGHLQKQNSSGSTTRSVFLIFPVVLPEIRGTEGEGAFLIILVLAYDSSGLSLFDRQNARYACEAVIIIAMKFCTFTFFWLAV
jgi:hypothetical protein